jgi:hypothetical protein
VRYVVPPNCGAPLSVGEPPAPLADCGDRLALCFSDGQASATFGPGNLLELFWELFLRHDVTASFLGTSDDLASGSSPPFVVGPLL